VEQKVNFFIGERKEFLKKKQKMKQLIAKLEGNDTENLYLDDQIIESSVSSTSEFECSSSPDEEYSSDDSSSANKSSEYSEDIRTSQSKINNLRRSLQNSIKNKPAKKHKIELQKGENSNPLDSDPENKSIFEGGEEESPKPKREKRKKIIRRKKKNIDIESKQKDINRDIDVSIKLIDKAKKIIQEYNKIFCNLHSAFPENMSIATK
jgi:hypothetical protein